MSLKLIDMVTALLLIAAGLYVGLLAVNVDLVAAFPLGERLQQAVFGLVGVAALYQFLQWRAIRRRIKS